MATQSQSGLNKSGIWKLKCASEFFFAEQISPYHRGLEYDDRIPYRWGKILHLKGLSWVWYLTASDGEIPSLEIWEE